MSLERLGLCREATTLEVQTAFRRLAAKRHPDRGGTHEEMVELNLWLAEAMHELETPLICGACDGLGYALTGSGFSQMRMTCPACGGAGTTNRERS